MWKKSFVIASVLWLGTAASAQTQGSFLLTLEDLSIKPGVLGDMTVTIAGKTFSTPANTPLRTDITRLLKPGLNDVRIRWGQNCNMLCTVRIAYATEKNRYRTVFDFKPGQYNPGQGDYTYQVVADGPRNAGRVSSGSAPRQTLLKSNVPSGFVTVWVNGEPLGDLTGIVDRDISSYVKPGANQLKLVWDKKYGTPAPFGNLSVSYAATQNNFRPLWNIQNDGTAAKTATYTFTLP